jgi:amino acid transporter
MSAPARSGLRPSLSVWQAVGISVALMAPSMAANINPQGTAGLVGRATPPIVGGLFFTAVTAIEMMAFTPTPEGVEAFIASPALMGDLGSSYVGAWKVDLITLGACVSAFGCCLACLVGASRLLFAIGRDLAPGHPLGSTGRNETLAAAAVVVTGVVMAIALLCAVFFDAEPFDTFLWSGTIGTLVLLVACALATVGLLKLIWVDKKLTVPGYETVIPVLALVMLGYTICRNVIPYPTEGPARWFPVVAFGWLALVSVVAVAVPGFAQRLGAGLAALDRDAAGQR